MLWSCGCILLRCGVNYPCVHEPLLPTYQITRCQLRQHILNVWSVACNDFILKCSAARSPNCEKRQLASWPVSVRPSAWNNSATTVRISMKFIRRGADKSLARPGRKQATATKLEIYSTYSPRSSIHFSARCSNFFKPLRKNSESCSSNEVSATAMTSASHKKWRHFNCFFFSPGNRW